MSEHMKRQWPGVAMSTMSSLAVTIIRTADTQIARSGDCLDIQGKHRRSWLPRQRSIAVESSYDPLNRIDCWLVRSLMDAQQTSTNIQLPIALRNRLAVDPSSNRRPLH